jgi:hypothetical protein
MSASSQPLRLLWTEMHNGLPPLVAAPDCKRLLRPFKVGKIDMGRDCATNDALRPVVIDNVEHSVPVLNVQRCLNVDFSFKQTPHSPPLCSFPLVPERHENEAGKINKGKTLTHVGLRYLQTVVSKRQAAPSVASSNAVGLTTPIPFDNDNEPLREAAHVMA